MVAAMLNRQSTLLHVEPGMEIMICTRCFENVIYMDYSLQTRMRKIKILNLCLKTNCICLYSTGPVLVTAPGKHIFGHPLSFVSVFTDLWAHWTFLFFGDVL